LVCLQDLQQELFHIFTNALILCRFVADLVIGWMQDLAAGEVMAAGGMEGGWLKDLQPQTEPSVDVGRPLQKDNWGNIKEQCVLDPSSFQKLVQVVQASVLSSASLWDSIVQQKQH